MVQDIGQITPDGINALKRRAGMQYNVSPHLASVSEDEIRLFCERQGINNPLYTDDDYAKHSPYGTVIAPPGFFDLFYHHSATAVGGLRGVQSFYGGSDIEFFEPLRPGDSLTVTYRPLEPVEKEGRFGGPMVMVYVEVLYRNQRGRIAVRVKNYVLRVSRTTGRDRGKYDYLGKAAYTEEQLQAIWDAQESYGPRGGAPLYWEDVSEGDSMPTMVRGPLRTAEIALAGGGGGSHYYQMAGLRQQPGYGTQDPSTGIEGSPLGGHWEEGLARRLGIPGIYDVGSMRTFWLGQYASDWAGDHAWLKRLYAEIRRFNLVGDTSTLKGQVAAKWIEDDEYLVQLQLHVEDQRGEITAPGWAIVALPSRDGKARLPYNSEVLR